MIRSERSWASRIAPWTVVPVLCVLAALVDSARGGMMIENGIARPMPWREIFSASMYDFAWWMVLGPVVFVAVRPLLNWDVRPVTRAAAAVAGGLAVCCAYFLLR